MHACLSYYHFLLSRSHKFLFFSGLFCGACGAPGTLIQSCSTSGLVCSWSTALVSAHHSAFVTYSKSHAPHLAGAAVTTATLCDGGWRCYDVVAIESNLWPPPMLPQLRPAPPDALHKCINYKRYCEVSVDVCDTSEEIRHCYSVTQLLFHCYCSTLTQCFGQFPTYSEDINNLWPRLQTRRNCVVSLVLQQASSTEGGGGGWALLQDAAHKCFISSHYGSPFSGTTPWPGFQARTDVRLRLAPQTVGVHWPQPGGGGFRGYANASL